MARLILEEWVSLDGYAEDAQGDLSFFPDPLQNGEFDKDQLAFLENIGLIVLGRKTYQMFAGYWPEMTSDKELIADRLNALPKIVFSDTLQKAPWGNLELRIFPTDVVQSFRELKKSEQKDIILWGSLSLAAHLIEEDVADECRINLCPMLTGGGKTFYPESGKKLPMDLVETKTYPSGMVQLVYRKS